MIVPEGFTQAKDLTGQTLPDATVNIIDPATGDIIATTTTDSNGYYQVFVPAGGPYILEAIKDGVKLQQVTPQVEVGIEYDLGTADCDTTSVALIAQAMLDAEDYPDDLADINLTDIETDSDFNDVRSDVCSKIATGEDPAASALVQQAVEDFLHPPAPTPTPAPAPPSLSDAKAITAFDFIALDPDVVGVINEGAKTIILTVPFGTDVTALVPTIIYTGVSVSPASVAAQDFTSPVDYTVTAEDSTTAVYTVTVTEPALTVINIAAIPGVTVPEIGATPVTTIAATDQYTGTVTWVPADNPLQGNKVYVATITLTAKPGFTLTGVAANFFTVAGATIVTNTTDSGVVTAIFPETLVVGQSYGGGIVAYILRNVDPGYDANVQHGLIAATGDQSTGIAWITGGNTQTTWVNGTDYGGTSIDYGTGQANTNAMMDQTGYAGGAAEVCDDYTNADTGTGVYSDWFLPSKEELNKLYINRVAIGGFVDDYDWGSSEGNANHAWYQYFFNGSQYNYFKSRTDRVRAVRAF